MNKNINKKIVIVNQASNYLTVGLCNAFNERFNEVVLIAGSVHEQGERLNGEVKVHHINRWYDDSNLKKISSYLIALVSIYFLLRTKYRKYEVLFVSIPPMAYLLNIIIPNKSSMIVWDVYPDILKVTGINEKNWIYKLWAKLNIKSFNKAFRIFTIGNKVADLIEQYTTRNRIIIQPIWSIFQENVKLNKKDNPFIKKHKLENKFIVQYSGNIGLTHKIDALLKIATILKNEDRILFQIIGRGARVESLKEKVRTEKINNCTFLPFQSDELFLYSLSAADLGVVILDMKTSKGSVPSKSYNLMSLGIPSLYISSDDSELAQYAEQFKNAKCFSEQQIEEAAAFIKEISSNYQLWQEMSENAKLASKEFTRKNADRIVDKYISNDS